MAAAAGQPRVQPPDCRSSDIAGRPRPESTGRPARGPPGSVSGRHPGNRGRCSGHSRPPPCRTRSSARRTGRRRRRRAESAARVFFFLLGPVGRRGRRLGHHALQDPAVVDPVARRHHPLLRRLQIDRRGDGGRGVQRRTRALLSQIFQQHVGAQREPDGNQPINRHRRGQPGDHGPQVLAAPGMILGLAQPPRRPGAPQVEPQHRMPRLQQGVRGPADVDRVLAAGQAVQQDRQRLACGCGRPVPAADQAVAGAIRHLERKRFRRPGREVRTGEPMTAASVLRKGLQVAAAPRKLLGKQQDRRVRWPVSHSRKSRTSAIWSSAISAGAWPIPAASPPPPSVRAPPCPPPSRPSARPTRRRG